MPRTRLAGTVALALLVAGTSSGAEGRAGAAAPQRAVTTTPAASAAPVAVAPAPRPAVVTERLGRPIVVRVSDPGLVLVPPSPKVLRVMVRAYRDAVADAPPSCGLTVGVLGGIGQAASGTAAGRTLDDDHRVVPPILGPVAERSRTGRPGQAAGAASRARGPLQLDPQAWRAFGRDGDGDGRADPQDVEDAVASAAALLCAEGRDLRTRRGLRAALAEHWPGERFATLVLRWRAVFDEAGPAGPLPADAWALATSPAGPAAAAAWSTRPGAARARPAGDQSSGGGKGGPAGTAKPKPPKPEPAADGPGPAQPGPAQPGPAQPGSGAGQPSPTPEPAPQPAAQPAPQPAAQPAPSDPADVAPASEPDQAGPEPPEPPAESPEPLVPDPAEQPDPVAPEPLLPCWTDPAEAPAPAPPEESGVLPEVPPTDEETDVPACADPAAPEEGIAGTDPGTGAATPEDAGQ